MCNKLGGTGGVCIELTVNKMGNVRINVTLRRVLATISAVEK
jgi:hypothetical protein